MLEWGGVGCSEVDEKGWGGVEWTRTGCGGTRWNWWDGVRLEWDGTGLDGIGGAGWGVGGWGGVGWVEPNFKKIVTDTLQCCCFYKLILIERSVLILITNTDTNTQH